MKDSRKAPWVLRGEIWRRIPCPVISEALPALARCTIGPDSCRATVAVPDHLKEEIEWQHAQPSAALGLGDACAVPGESGVVPAGCMGGGWKRSAMLGLTPPDAAAESGPLVSFADSPVGQHCRARGHASDSKARSARHGRIGRPIKWICSLGTSLGVFAMLLAGCSKGPPPHVSVPQVYTLSIKQGSVVLRRQFVGRVSAYRSANVVARVSGVLLDRLYREGSEVHRGQLLFQIDPAFYKAQLDNDLAVLAEDRATLVNADITAARDHKLLGIGSVSQQTMDDANATARSAAAKVQADEAIVEGARLNLGYTRVVAPIEGIAGQQQVTVGAIVGSGTSDSGAAGTLLTTIEQINSVYVNFAISAADLVALRQAQALGKMELASQSKARVAIELPDGAAYPNDGTLDFSGVLVNATTGAINMRAIVLNPAHVLLPGMYVTLTADLGQQNGVFLVPQLALQRDALGAYVLVVGADGKVVRKNVVARDTYASDWIVTQGLANGDRVIISGLQRVREGQRVVARAWRPAAPAKSDAASARQ